MEPTQKNITTMFSALYPGQLASIHRDVLGFYRENLFREIERLTPEGLIRVSTLVANINEDVFKGEKNVELPTSPEYLPPGWEKRMLANGRVYYVDHNIRTTSWSAPKAISNEEAIYNTLFGARSI